MQMQNGERRHRVSKSDLDNAPYRHRTPAGLPSVDPGSGYCTVARTVLDVLMTN